MPGIYNTCIKKFNSYIYVVTGVGNLHYNQTQGGLYRYDLVNQVWENLYQSDFDNQVSRTTYNAREKGGCLLFGNLLFVISGWDLSQYKSIDNFKFVNLSDPDYNWNTFIDNAGSGRDSFSFSQNEYKMFGFGGFVGINRTLSNQLTIIEGNSPPNFASQEYPSPEPRSFHSMTLINGKFYVFGGINGNKLYNDLWVFNPEKILWESINFIGSIPSGRYGFAYGSQGDAIVIWGGTDFLGLRNDLYIFYTFSSAWEIINALSTDGPKAAEGACLDVSIPKIYIYGGYTSTGVSNTLYEFNLWSNTYTLLSTDRSVAYATCKFINPNFYVIFGQTDYSTPNMFVRVFNITSEEWSTYLQLPSNTVKSTRGVTLFIDGNIVEIGGQTLNMYPSNKITYYSPSNSSEFLVLGNIPEFPYNSAVVYYKTKFYIFGGGEVTGESLIQSQSINRMYEIGINEICKDSKCTVLCSEGTQSGTDSCELCKPGTYSNFYGNDSCLECPAGTYNPYSGSSSNRQCYPCGSNSFNSLTGQSYCVDCLTGYICPPGSIEPIDFVNLNSVKSIQPKLYTQASISDRILKFEITVGLVVLFLIVICMLYERTRRSLHKFDIYNKLHNYEIGKIMYLRNTIFGGVASLAFIGIAIIIIGSTLMNFIDNNILETKSLVPKVILDEEVGTFESEKFIFVIKLYRYGDLCQNIESYAFNFDYSEMSISSELDSNTCIIYIEFSKCVINVGAYLKVISLETLSYASGIEVNVTTNSSIPNEISSMSSVIFPSGNNVFIGSDDSIFYYVLTPSLFKSDSSKWKTDLKGYHIAVSSSPSAGSQFLTSELSIVSQLNLKIYLELSDSGLYTYRYYKQTLIYVASALLGSIFGIMGAVGGIMSMVEKNSHKFKKLLEKKKNFNKISNKRQDFDKQFDKQADQNALQSVEEDDEFNHFTNI